MSNYDDLERRYSCFSEPTQVLRRHPHRLSLMEVAEESCCYGYLVTKEKQNGE